MNEGWPLIAHEAYARFVKLLGKSSLGAEDVERIHVETMLTFEPQDEAKDDEGRRVLGELARAFERARLHTGTGRYATMIRGWLKEIPSVSAMLMRDWAQELAGRPPELRTKIVRHYRAVGFKSQDGRRVRATNDALALLLLASGWRSAGDDFGAAFASEVAAVKAVDKR